MELAIIEFDTTDVSLWIGLWEMAVLAEESAVIDAPTLSVTSGETIGDTEPVLEAIFVADSSDVPVTSKDIVGIIVDVVNDDPDNV